MRKTAGGTGRTLPSGSTLDTALTARLPAAAIGEPARMKMMLQGPRTDNEYLLAFAQTRDEQLRTLLVERYLPLARSIARRYAGRAEPLDDLVQVASLGLVKAIDRFDPSRGVAFSSFAVPTIAGEIRRHFRDRCWAVRPPRDLQDRALAVDRHAKELTDRLGHSPTIRQIGQALELSDEDVLEAMEAVRAMSATSLSASRATDEDGDNTLEAA